MSLDKDPVSRQNVIDHLRQPGPYQDPALADDMERARDRRGDCHGPDEVVVRRRD